MPVKRFPIFDPNRAVGELDFKTRFKAVESLLELTMERGHPPDWYEHEVARRAVIIRAEDWDPSGLVSALDRAIAPAEGLDLFVAYLPGRQQYTQPLIAGEHAARFKNAMGVKRTEELMGREILVYCIGSSDFWTAYNGYCIAISPPDDSSEGPKLSSLQFYVKLLGPL